MDKECSGKTVMIQGLLEEFANGFTIRTDGEALFVLHGSPETPYEEVKKYIHQSAEMQVTETGHIIDMHPFQILQKSVE